MSDVTPAPLTRRELRAREQAAALAAAEAAGGPAASHAVSGEQAVAEPLFFTGQTIPTETPVDVAHPAPAQPAAAYLARQEPVQSGKPSSGEHIHTPSEQPSMRPRRDDAPRTRVRKMRGISQRRAKIALSAPLAERSRPAGPARGKAFRRSTLGSRALSFGVLFFAGAMVVGLSVPASLFTVTSPTAVTAADLPSTPVDKAAQVLPLADTAQADATVARDSWTMSSVAELQQTSLVRVDTSYSVDNSGPVRWPFPVAVPISDGYGARVSPCSGCSTQHKGTDFTPGVGTAIAAIADGVVSLKEVSSWGFGNHVFIDHVINGQKVTTVYAHMIAGSSELKVGDVVKEGDFVGLVGQTGAATGPHLHFEVRIDGVQVNPFLWLQANTGS